MEPAKFYIYAHYIPGETIPFYIGKGCGYRITRKNNRSIWWKRIVNKHGFEAKILYENLTQEEASVKEKELIQKYGRKDIKTGVLINHTDGGDGCKNLSAEVRKKISIANSKRVLSKETKDKISGSSKGHKLSAITKSKMKGRIPWNKGKTGLQGKSHTEETKLKISSKKKEMYMRNKKSKKEYTTILISKEINQHISEFCKTNGRVARSVTEMLWANYISSSMSGSIVL